MKEATPDQVKELTRFHKDWRDAKVRVEMAQQSLAGAAENELAKQARFLGAAEFVFGSVDVGFDYDAKTDTLVFRLPNREARRAKAKRKK